MIQIQYEKPLERLTTFQLQSTAEAYAEPATVEELAEAFAFAREKDLDVHVLGGGANVVAMQRVPGLVVRPNFTGIRRETDAAGFPLVVAGAAEPLDAVVRRAAEWGLGGLENLAAIPGSVGGAVVQNAGAYGVELAERFLWCRAWDPATREVHSLTLEDCDFGYRTSAFKRGAGRRWVILEAAFRLPKTWTPVITYKDLAAKFEGREAGTITPAEVEAAVRAARAAKLPDPVETGNAGSFFKNPVVTKLNPTLVVYPLAGGRAKLAAGWLIDAAGFRGHQVGRVGVSPNHALVLVNHGGATGEDVLALAREIALKVERRFGVELEPEPVFMGGAWSL